MNCQQAQNDLLSAESLALLGPELSAHLAECPQCQALLAQLRHLEAQAQALPMPAGHEQPSPEFLRTIVAAAARSGPRVGRFFRQAIAAAVVLAFTLAAVSLIFFNGSTVQADVLIGQLVDWNLAIAHTHDTTTRTRLYQQQLQQLQTQVDQSKLAPADRALAVALLNNAHWMTTEENAADESQHFHSLANQLLTSQQAASSGAAAHFQQIYQELISQGASGGGAAPASSSPVPQSTQQTPAAPSSSLPQNSNPATSAFKATALMAAPATSGRVVLIETPRPISTVTAISGSDEPGYLSRPLAGADTGALRASDGHVRHAGAHSSSSSSDSLAPLADAPHPAPSAANLASSSPPPGRSDDDAPVHPTGDSSSPAPDPSCQGGPPPLWSTALAMNSADRNGRLASLADASRWQPTMRENLPQAFDLEKSDQGPGSILMPLMPPGGPMSRHEIETILTHHINDHSAELSDWTRPNLPPMGQENCPLFAADGGHEPIPFPEPTPALSLLLAILALPRRRRRI